MLDAIDDTALLENVDDTGLLENVDDAALLDNVDDASLIDEFKGIAYYWHKILAPRSHLQISNTW